MILVSVKWISLSNSKNQDRAKFQQNNASHSSSVKILRIVTGVKFKPLLNLTHFDILTGYWFNDRSHFPSAVEGNPLPSVYKRDLPYKLLNDAISNTNITTTQALLFTLQVFTSLYKALLFTALVDKLPLTCPNKVKATRSSRFYRII